MPKQNFIHVHNVWWKKGNKHQNDQVQWIYTVAQIKKMIICLSVD